MWIDEVVLTLSLPASLLLIMLLPTTKGKGGKLADRHKEQHVTPCTSLRRHDNVIKYTGDLTYQISLHRVRGTRTQGIFCGPLSTRISCDTKCAENSGTPSTEYSGRTKRKSRITLSTPELLRRSFIKSENRNKSNQFHMLYPRVHHINRFGNGLLW